MNTRRHWIAAAVASPAAALTEALWAQSKAPVVIGVLSANSKGRGGDLFNEGMATLG